VQPNEISPQHSKRVASKFENHKPENFDSSMEDAENPFLNIIENFNNFSSFPKLNKKVRKSKIFMIFIKIKTFYAQKFIDKIIKN